MRKDAWVGDLVWQFASTSHPRVFTGAEATRDWLDYVGAFSGFLGALLAAVAILYAARQSAQVKRDLIHERRMEFELGLLADLRHQMSITELQHVAGYVGALIVDRNDESDLPLLRAAIGVKAGPEGKRRFAELQARASGSRGSSRNSVLEMALSEVDAAIERRVNESGR